MSSPGVIVNRSNFDLDSSFWHRHQIVFDSTSIEKVRTYIDGVKQSDYQNININDGAELTFDKVFIFGGMIDEFYVQTYAPSETEIIDFYNIEKDFLQAAQDEPIAICDSYVYYSTPSIVPFSAGQSRDMYNRPLTYSWSLVSKPSGSIADILDPSSVSPTLNVDVYGDYSLELIVNNGIRDSAPVQCSAIPAY
jgi:hypothetical protein